MSTDVSKDLISVSIDGRDVKARPGELLIAAAEEAGIFIPRFCYHPRLPQVGMCRMCLVEVSGPRGFSLQPSCYVPVSDGMEVITDSEKVKKAQDGVLEFLLINHPLDCPVCDKGGECPLQDQTLAYGPGESRFAEEKRHFEKPIAISELVFLDRERCIQCDRCTRFADVVAGDALIEFIGRGDNTEVNVFPERPFSSYFSGNTVQICPVGALTAAPYRFKSRPWDLAQVESSCITCSMGCRIMVQSSQNQVIRYIGLDSDQVNHGWLCDKGRFGHESLSSPDRVTAPLIRKGDSYVETSWANAISIISSKISGIKEKIGSDRIGFIIGSKLTNEDIYAWVKLAKGVIGTDSVDSQLGDGISADVISRLNRATINDAVTAKVVLSFTGDIKEEIPVLYLRLREAVKNGHTKVITIATHSSSLDGISEIQIFPSLDQLRPLAQQITSDSSYFPEVASLIKSSGVSADGEGLVVLLGRENLAWDQTVVEAFALELARVAPKAKFLVTLHGSNFSGSVDLGAVPRFLPGRSSLSDPSAELRQKWSSFPSHNGKSVKEMFKSALKGEMDLLFLIGSDPRTDFVDTALSNAALDEIGFVVSVDTFMSESSSKADLVLPAAAFAEKYGTITNLEERIMTVNQKVTPPGLCRPDWEIACEIALEMGSELGFTSPEEILDEISNISSLHWGLSFDRLSRLSALEGVVIPLTSTPLTLKKKPMFDQISTPGIASVWNQGLASSKTSFIDSSASISDESDSPTESQVPTAISAEPIWPLPPMQATSEMPLVYCRRLYSQGQLLKNSPHLSRLAVEPRCRISSETAKAIGVTVGESVRLIDKAGGAGVFEVEIDDGVREGWIEMVKGMSSSQSFSPIRVDETMNFVKLERV